VLTAGLLASIPSPSSGSIHIGSLQLRMYGLMIALGVIAAVWLFGRRMEQKAIGTRDDAASIALWAVPAGVIGARLYHVITDWQLFRDDPVRVFYIWEGGLGIWGGIALGVAVGLWRAAKKGIPLLPAADCAAPALALAQAIGRLGNWWNQELFGRPTDLPWGLEISPSNRPDGYEQFATFHPTFLYEALWNLGLCLALVAIDRRFRLRPGRLFVMYVAGYTFARFWIEGLRIDSANEFAGLRVNEWVSAIVFLLAAGFLVVDWLRHRHDPVDEVVDAEEPGPAEGVSADGPAGVTDAAEDQPEAVELAVSDDETLVSDLETPATTEAELQPSEAEEAADASPQPSDHAAAPATPTPNPAKHPEASWGAESVPNRRPTDAEG
jgi:prolipoprotein diacylglyceryl transferase